METKQIINGLLDRADRVADQSAGRIMRQAAERLRELEERLFVHRELAAKQQWIPVSERLPEEWTNVLVYSGGNYDILMYRPNRRSTLCFMYQDECGYWTEKHRPPVTHWMPLPAPSKFLRIRSQEM